VRTTNGLCASVWIVALLFLQLSVPVATAQMSEEEAMARLRQRMQMRAAQSAELPTTQSDSSAASSSEQPAAREASNQSTQFPPAGNISNDDSDIFHAAEFYEQGTGVAKDPSRAFVLYMEAANDGYAPAMQKVAECLMFGNGTKQNYQKAVSWAEKAVDANDAAAAVDLGWLYENGRGVQPNPLRAVSLYRRAADLGDPTGMCDLAVCYENGTGMPCNLSEAFKWYQKAADKGSDIGMYSLGMMNLLGEGIPENDKEAARWFLMAAKKGNSKAVTALSLCHVSESKPENPSNSAILDAVLAPGMDARDGFNDVHLGATYKQLNDQFGGVYFAADVPGCIKAKDEEYFLLSNGQLVAYWRKYSGDNEGWIEKFKEVLGPAQNDKMFRSSHVSAEGTSENLTAWYDFLDSVVTLDAIWINNGFPQEWVTASIFDRQWLRGVQDRQITRKRDLLTWLSKVISDLDDGKAFSSLDVLPGTSIVTEGGLCGFMIIPDKDFSSRKIKLWLPFRIRPSGRMNASIQRVGGAISVAMDLDPLLSTSGAAQTDFDLEPLRGHVNVELAKELFPSDDGAYVTETSPSSLLPSFSWRFGDWSVRVTPDNSIYLARSPQKKL
jgi:TPR repeat protein